MINCEQIELAALFGIEESFAEGAELADTGWFRDSMGEIVDDWQGQEIAEAVYTHFLGYH